MIIKPMVRNNICLNSHPAGCAATVRRHIDYVKKSLQPGDKTPKLALIIGCSTGYGLASRIAAGFGYGAATVGISYEKPASETKPGTPGFYNNMVFDQEARKAGNVSITLNGDAFSNELKADAIKAIRKAAEEAGIPPKVDLVIYSLASPVRTDPKTGITYKSVIKPIGKSFSGTTVDMMTGKISVAGAEPAIDEEIANTIKVMGGEDWELWIDAIAKEGLLSSQARTIAYTYIGPELSWAIYKNGTIGRAKEDLERAVIAINKTHGKIAWVSVNKALVTRSSAVIPIIPLYISCLFKVMKEMGLHEGCIEQITRLYKDRLYAAGIGDPAAIPTDANGRIRIDDWEMREDVQKLTVEKMNSINAENVFAETDLAGVRHDFYEAHGFDVPGVDYNADINTMGINL